MNLFLHEAKLPVYKSLSTREYYICKNDILEFYRSQFEGISKKYNMPLPAESEELRDSYKKRLAGTCEFILSSDWQSAISKCYVNCLREISQATRNPNIQNDCQVLTSFFEITMKNSPELLLPYKEGNPKLKAVRLFKERKGAFAMAAELEYVINGKMREMDPLDFLETVDSRAVLEAWEKNKFEILITQPTNSLIFTPTGNYCRLPEHVLIEVVVYATLQKKIFHQKFADQQKTLEKFRCVIREVFPFDKKHRFFMTEKQLVEIKEAITTVFEDVKHNKKKMEVKSKDRTVAYFTGLFPEIMEFFHNHNGCVIYRCPRCPVEPTVSFEQEAMEMLKGLEKTANTATIGYLDSVPTSPDQEKYSNEKITTSDVENSDKTTTTSDEEKYSDKKTTTPRSKKNKKKKKVVNAPKKPEPSDEEVPVQDATTIVPDVPAVSESSESANSTDKSDTEPEDLPVKTIESFSTCRKCFRTSEHCKKAKEQLKKSQNALKKLEKKNFETEKLMEAMKKKMQEELDALKLKNEQSRNVNEQQRLEYKKEIEILKEENEKLRVDNEKLKEAVKKVPVTTESAESTPREPPMSKEERHAMIFNLQEKDAEVRESDVWKKTELKVSRLIKTKPDLQKMAQDELSNLNFQIQSYYKAVDTNLLAILNDKDMTRSQVPALPSFPAVSERFNTEYQKMLDEENKKLENECMICTEVVDKNKHEDVFTCPVCQKDIHLDCVERWFQRSQTCPCCRTEWN